jgi:CPA2 family monovalent cation:H+ antiporter-2
MRDRQIPYIYGNCASPLVLEKAEVQHAKSMVVVTRDSMSTRLCVKNAIAIAPNLDIVARAFSDSDIDSLYILGAREVVHPEFEASLELSTHLLLRLGESKQTVQSEIINVRNSRYADLRPDLVCPLPVLTSNIDYLESPTLTGLELSEILSSEIPGNSKQ